MFSRGFEATTLLFARIGAVATVTLCATSPLYAVDLVWDGGGPTALWTDPVNWNPDQVPGTAPGGPADRAIFSNAAAKAAVISADIPTLDSIIFNAVDATGVGARLNQTGGNARLVEVDTAFRGDGGFFRIGEAGGAGTYNLSGGLMEADRIIIGLQGGTTANLNLSGTGVLRQRDVPNVNDATGNTWSGFAEDGGSTANVNISGGTLSFFARTFLGRNGTANITQTGGTLEVRNGELNLGDTGTSNYNLSGGTLRTLNADSVTTIGQWDNGHGTLNVTNTGVADFAGELFVAAGQDPAPTTGTLSVGGGGTVTLHEGINVGQSLLANGTLNIMNGGQVRQVDVADRENQQTWSRIGNNGTSTFNITGTGVLSVDARLHFGAGASSVSTINQTGGTVEARRHEVIIGDLGRVTYNISAGTVQTLEAGRPIAVGNWNNSNARLNVSGTGQVISAGNLTIGQVENTTNTGSGTVDQTGGLVRIAGDINMGLNSPTASGTYILNGGTLDMTGGAINKGIGVATFTFTNGVLQDLASYNIGNLNQQGGVLAPGAVGGSTASRTTVNGNYSLGNTGTLRLELNTGVADALTVNGTVTLSGNLDLVAGSALAPRSDFIIIDNDGADAITGTFAGRPNGVAFLEDGNVYTIFYNGGDGNDVRLVPEPASAALLLAGVSACGLLGRRRRV